MKPIVIIPARMAATRLPGKPLADIEGLPMIVRVLRQAQAAGVGPVAVAAGDAEIVEAVTAAGGRAVLTDPDLPSGSDRLVAALAELDPQGHHDVIINLQGDMPFVQPVALTDCLAILEREPTCDIATIVEAETSPAVRTNPDMVKAVLSLAPDRRSGRALYFTRSTLYGDAPVWHHHGIYAYRREALLRFTAAAVEADAFRPCLVLFLRRCLDVSDAPPTNPLEFPRNAVVEDVFAAAVAADDAAVSSLSDSVVSICRLAAVLTVAWSGWTG